MPNHFISLLIGSVITTFPAIIYSVWVETRFVNRTPGLLYGLASLGSGFLFYADFGSTEIGFWSLGIFLALGTTYLIAWRKLNIWGQEHISLPFSHKTIGGFQVAFFYHLYLVPIFYNLPMLAMPLSVAQNVVLWGAIFVGLLYGASGIAWIIKNHVL